MGSALYIVPERELPDFEVLVNGKALSSAERKLARIATEVGVTPLMGFFSISPDEASAFLENEDVGSEVVEVAEESWFDSSEGLATIDGLTRYLNEHPDSLSNSAAILSDLAEFKSVLTQLSQNNVRWHLAIDY